MHTECSRSRTLDASTPHSSSPRRLAERPRGAEPAASCAEIRGFGRGNGDISRSDGQGTAMPAGRWRTIRRSCYSRGMCGRDRLMTAERATKWSLRCASTANELRRPHRANRSRSRQKWPWRAAMVSEIASANSKSTHVGVNHEEHAAGRKRQGSLRAKQDVPPAVRRQVLRRDRHRCQVPGCAHANFVDVHHVRTREAAAATTPKISSPCVAPTIARATVVSSSRRVASAVDSVGAREVEASRVRLRRHLRS
jgi:hypothetical protein